MNELNYASLEASKKLYDAGIVLETDYIWAGAYGTTVSFENQKWVLIPKSTHNVQIPSPSMAEVWRELPAGASVYKGTSVEIANTAACMVDRVKTPYIEKANPTDALIDLLIFVRKEKP